jgi:hypothetical protein
LPAIGEIFEEPSNTVRVKVTLFDADNVYEESSDEEDELPYYRVLHIIHFFKDGKSATNRVDAQIFVEKVIPTRLGL